MTITKKMFLAVALVIGASSVYAQSNNTIAQQVVELINKKRTTNKKSALSLDNDISVMADKHCKEMIANSKTSLHNGYESRKDVLVKRFGHKNAISLYETVAQASTADEAVQTWWKNNVSYTDLNRNGSMIGVAAEPISGGKYMILVMVVDLNF